MRGRPSHLLAPLAALLVCIACGPDGPPIPTAGEAVALEPSVQAELIEQAPAVTLAVTLPPAPGEVGGAGGPTGVADPSDDGAGAETSPMPSSVVVIGDSIALSAQPLVIAMLESLGVDLVAYDAVESRRMVAGSSSLPSGAEAIEDVLAAGRLPELWIVALGTNDVGAASDADAVSADIGRLLSLIPDGVDLIWIDTWVRDRDGGARMVNDAIRESLAERDSARVLDWYGHGATEGLVIADGVHLSDVGKVEYARMIGDALVETYERP